ncbi:5-methyltetrahydropteroyltriglutamate--homocysteine methyltransferase [Halorubrum sp. JWXQ-INN 858]|uniref:5-methyltetrahydropteroyltriglutamate-- homocysteine methyltransferase n=1 Tax=Halorubrum sp. JWXQ-INN 858 TaxID=2690782 RepID=UPI0013587EE2|nr:5-methyltetrahydropteroyltriglutamate--homocysteine methyltransferase [Halorubrum sp. JWXQ-INN 858]MWV64724.1 5-methyltetrahydropteroyltriglutamate--homocysteine methyltransferase [Halorubrum sp. JWXQ-INN 858]
MTERVATTPGLYPLPDWAKETLSDLKGHQKGDLLSGDEGAEIESVYDEVRAEYVDDQLEAGVDRVVEGQARWDDMIAHPLTVHDAVETGGIVRYYDNNNFYRDPRVTGELTPSGDVAAELTAAADVLARDAPLQATLPGPYSLADLASDEHYGDEAAFQAAVADFLAGEVDSFPDHETLFLLEPSLVENPPAAGEEERATDAIRTVAAATDADVVVHTYWGALGEKLYAHLVDEAGADALGLDLVADDRDDTVYNVQEYGATDSLALGVVDGQNTLVEGAETTADRVEWFESQVPAQSFDTTYLTSNTEPFYLPENKYKEKLAALAAAVEVLE